jgi:Tfp pilus assembly protein PilN
MATLPKLSRIAPRRLASALQGRADPGWRRRGADGPSARGVAPDLPLMRAFNLLPSETGGRARPQSAAVARLVLSMGGLLVVALLAWAYLWTSADLGEKRAAYDGVRTELAALDVTADAPAARGEQALLEERQARTAALASALGGRVAWDRLLREVSLVLPDDVWLTSLSARASQAAASEGADAGGEGSADAGSPTGSAAQLFVIEGYARSQPGVARLLARLSVVPSLRAVQLLSSSRTTVARQDVVQFSMVASVKRVGESKS